MFKERFRLIVQVFRFLFPLAATFKEYVGAWLILGIGQGHYPRAHQSVMTTVVPSTMEPSGVSAGRLPMTAKVEASMPCLGRSVSTWVFRKTLKKK